VGLGKEFWVSEVVNWLRVKEGGLGKGFCVGDLAEGESRWGLGRGFR
jgi:hypothetical protein